MHQKIFLIFTGDTAALRKNDFFSGEIEFDFISLENYSIIRKLKIIFNIIKRYNYDELIICGVNELTSWLCAFISPYYKNSTVVESSYHEATVTGLKGFLKKIFFKRISVTYASGVSQEKLTRLLKFKGKVIVTKGVGIFNIIKQPQFKPSVIVKDFIYVGRLSPEKNLVFLIEVFNKLKNINLHIIGYGPQEGLLKKIAKDNTFFYGAVENKKLPEMYQRCNVFILPSAKEPWGLVVEEALNNGLPVIVSNKVGCAEEIIEEDHNGLIFEFNSFTSLLGTITKMSDIAYYNNLKLNVSKLNFNLIADYQVNCYL